MFVCCIPTLHFLVGVGGGGQVVRCVCGGGGVGRIFFHIIFFFHCSIMGKS